jgi:hypothetical protein
MFFTDAPFTKDKQELIDSNKDDFIVEMDERLLNDEFPFCNHLEYKGYGINKEQVLDWKYNGLINALDLRRALNKVDEFKDLFFNLHTISSYLKTKNTKWLDKEDTRQAVLSDGKKKRLYCIGNKEILDEQDIPTGRYILELTEGELGTLYEAKEKAPF